MADVYLLLGGNQGDTRKILASANATLQEDGACRIIAQSALYRTKAWGRENQADFINQAVHLQTEKSPRELLQFVLKIERQYGRIRKEKWGPRTLDIDIIFYDDIIMDSPELTIPHPEMHNRNFVLLPLLEIAAEKEHPGFHKTILRLYLESNDSKKVSLLPEV